MIDGGWHRFHPLSPLLRGGVATVAVIGWVLSRQVDRVFGNDPEDPTQGHVGTAFLLVVVVLGGIVGAGWVAWRVSRYRLGPTTLEVHTGVLFRQHRQVPYDRIQAVDVVRPLLARLTGLAEVRVESAGGGDSNVRLAFLHDRAAGELRDELVDLAGVSDEVEVGPDPATGWGVGSAEVVGPPADPDVGRASASRAREGSRADPAAPPGGRAPGRERVVLTIPNERLVQSMLYSGASVFLVAATPTVVLAFLEGWTGILSTLGPATLAVGMRHVSQFVRWFNFSLAHTGEVLRVRHGLTELRTSSIPLHRIQAVEVTQGPAWRLLGWWRIQVNVAGTGGGQEGVETTVLPVGSEAEALGVLALVLPRLDTEAVRGGLFGSGPGGGFTVAPARARWIDPIGWRRAGYAVTPSSLVLRGGVVTRRCQVVPHARIQSLRLSRGPWESRLRVARVTLVSTPGPVRPAVNHLDTAAATALVREQVARSARARALRETDRRVATSGDSVAHSDET